MVTLLSPCSPNKGKRYLSKPVENNIRICGVAMPSMLDDRSCKRATTKIFGRRRYFTLFGHDPFLFPVKHKRAHLQCSLVQIPRCQPHPKASWPCYASLTRQALSQISACCKCYLMGWSDSVPLAFSHYRPLSFFLWFLAASAGFVSLASAYFLLLLLDEYMGSQKTYTELTKF